MAFRITPDFTQIIQPFAWLTNDSGQFSCRSINLNLVNQQKVNPLVGSNEPQRLRNPSLAASSPRMIRPWKRWKTSCASKSNW